MIEQILTISRNTFLESIRQPIFVVLLLLASFALLGTSQAAYTLDDDNKMMIDMGLSTIFVAGLFLAAFTATGVVSTEVENKTVLTVISKPVSRTTFVLGKYLGVASALGLATWILSLLLLLVVRHKVIQTASDTFDLPVITFGLLAWVLALSGAALGNYFYRWVFTSSFVLSLAGLMTLAWGLIMFINHAWQFQPLTAEFGPEGALAGGQILIAILLIFEAVLILTAVAIAASTRLGQIMTLIICSGVFVLGLVSQTMAGPDAARISWHDVYGLTDLLRWTLPRLMYAVLPNLQFLWLTDAFTQGLIIPFHHVAWLTAYTLAQIAALLCLAVALFQTREVG